MSVARSHFGVKKQVAYFSGDDGIDFRRWMRDVKETYGRSSLPDIEKVSYAQDSLIGRAREYFFDNRQRIEEQARREGRTLNLSDVECLLAPHFGKVTEVATKIEEWLKHGQEKPNKMREYSHNFHAIMSMIPNNNGPEFSQREYLFLIAFLRVLHLSIEMVDATRINPRTNKPYDNVHEFLDACVLAAEQNRLKKFKQSMATLQKGAPIPKEKGGNHSKTRGYQLRKVGGGKRKAPGSLLCHNCGEAGHFANACPKPPKKKRTQNPPNAPKKEDPLY